MLVHIGSKSGLDIYRSRLKFSWIEALRESANFNIDLLVIKTFGQMINIIDYAIKKELAGPYWVDLN